MPIYEYYCPDNHKIYQFFARSLAQGRKIPQCPDNPKFRMEKVISAFAVVGQAQETPSEPALGTANPESDSKMESAMAAMEQEFSSVDENDPRAMARSNKWATTRNRILRRRTLPRAASRAALCAALRGVTRNFTTTNDLA